MLFRKFWSREVYINKWDFLKEILHKKERLVKEIEEEKNTTTAIKLYEINENTYIADTPGFSTFDISEIPSQELEKLFCRV